MSDIERQWFRRAARHMKLMAALAAELEAMDAAWPYIYAISARAAANGNNTVLSPISRYVTDVRTLQARISRLQRRMQRHVAFAADHGVQIA